ncbi:hypothetical protein BB561_000280 [Smittium simulii]|uniref:DUF218 domain-containing protein n=1 Tax=Smittium simulii TaxID=133385 RepID=A0A2T9YZS2_9FUNG|nr:hypothetical protein BB561_000280 [Smittium simulii]
MSTKYVRINIPIISNSENWSKNTLPRRRISIKTFRTIFYFLLLVSFTLNIFYFTRPKPLPVSELLYTSRIKSKSTETTINNPLKPVKPVKYSELTDLIIVPGHGVYQNELSPTNETSWDITFKKKDQHKIFLRHIAGGIDALKQHERALLLFSGTATRPLPTFMTEALGYWLAAKKLNWLTPEIFSRVMTEEFARDSYENLLFSICRFYEITGNYPDRITVVGFGFKKNRFINLHLKAIRYPKIRFTYIGIDSDVSPLEDKNGELKNGYGPFKKDPYGCSEFLSSKKKSRNPQNKIHGYNLSSPQLSELINYCSKGHNDLFSGKLPWDI